MSETLDTMSGRKIFGLGESEWESEWNRKYGEILQRHPILMKIYRKIGTDAPNLIEELFERIIKTIYLIKRFFKRRRPPTNLMELSDEEIERLADQIAKEFKNVSAPSWNLGEFFRGWLHRQYNKLLSKNLRINTHKSPTRRGHGILKFAFGRRGINEFLEFYEAYKHEFWNERNGWIS